MKAVGLMSGGLDSAVAAKLISNLGVEVHGVHFRQPWIEKDPVKIRALAQNIGVQFHVIDLWEDYLEMLRSPQHGYGKAFNPCIDCHRFMVRKVGDLMKEIGAQFVFTGEVLAQRPMSQNKRALPLVEKGTGLEGYLLRPLSAKFLEETIPEQKGWIDRSQLMAISGRSRREQRALAEQWGIEGYVPTGGGCLITEKIFGAHMKDFLSWPYRDPKETAVLKWGRYFRVNEEVVVMLGRDQRENELLEEYAHEQDFVIKCVDFPGPLALIKATKAPDEEIFAKIAGLAQHFSKLKNAEPQNVTLIDRSSGSSTRQITAQKVSQKDLKSWER